MKNKSLLEVNSAITKKRSGRERSFILSLFFILTFLNVKLIGFVFPKSSFGEIKENKNIPIKSSEGYLEIRYPLVKVKFILSQFRGNIIFFDEEFQFLGYCDLNDGGKRTYKIPVTIKYQKAFSREKKKFIVGFHEANFQWIDFSEDDFVFRLEPDKKRAFFHFKNETKGEDKFRSHWGDSILGEGKLELSG
jgi:hypothetical protein